MEFAKRKERKRLQLNVTSLIDVVFILLIFFMVTSTFLEQPGIKLDLPSTRTNTPQQIKENTLTITRTNKMYLNDVPISFRSLSSSVRSLVSKGTKTFVIKADKSIPYGIVVKAMDVLRGCGIRKIIIATQVEK